MICIYKSGPAEIVNWENHSMSNTFSVKKILIAFGGYNFNDFEKLKIEVSRKYRIGSQFVKTNFFATNTSLLSYSPLP